MKHCGQCGKPYVAPACGPTHAAMNAGIKSVRSIFGGGTNGSFLSQTYRADPDDIAIVEAASLMAAGRQVKFVVIIREGRLIHVRAEDGGPT